MENKPNENNDIRCSNSQIKEHLVLINELITELGYHSILNKEMSYFISQISLLCHNSFFGFIRNLNYILNSPLIFLNEKLIEKNKSIQYIILLIYYFTTNNQSKHSKIILKLLNHLMVKLYQENYYNEKDLNSICQLVIRIDLNDLSIDNKNLNQNRKEYEFYFNYLNMLININNININKRNAIILNSLDYFINNFINTAMINHLSKDMWYLDYFHVLTQSLTKETILGDKEINDILNRLNSIITSIYRYNFSKQTMKYFVLSLKSMLVNFDSKTENETMENMQKLEYHMNIIKQIISSEIEFEKSGCIFIQKGFLFKGKNTKGLKTTINSQINSFTLIFSFKLIPFANDDNKESYPLISFITKDNNMNEITQLGFKINKREEKYKLILTSKQTTVDQDIMINPYTSYNIIIVLSSSPLGPSKRTLKIKYNKETTKDITLENCVFENSNFYLGYANSNDYDKQERVFQGEIGTVIFIKDILSDLILQNLTNLKGYYNMILYWVYKYDLHYIDKYTSVNMIKDKSIILAKNCIKKQRNSFLNSIEFILTPLCIQYIDHNQGIHFSNIKTLYKFNTLFVNSTQHLIKDRIELLCPSSNDFNIFDRKSTLFEFILNEGFALIILYLEYYYSVVSLLKLKDTNELLIQM